MKVKSLHITNVGMIADTVITFDKPLILFYGEIRQGKTTILNAVRWVCGGAFPTDIIRHGEKEAEVSLEFDGGMISRSWYVTKDGKTKAREVTFIRNGKPVPSPVAEIKRFLNPFLLDQDFLRNKTELERRQYFAEMFSVDTQDLDTEHFNNDREASNLRAKIKGYGEIDLTPVERVDIAGAKDKLSKLRSDYAAKKLELENQIEQMTRKHEQEVARVNSANSEILSHNSKCERAAETRLDIEGAIETHKRKIQELEAQLKAHVVPEKKSLLPAPTPPDRSERQKKILDLQPDTSALEATIQNGAAQNVRAEQYAKNKDRDSKRRADEKALTALEQRQREIKKEKQSRLKTVSDSCGIKGLSFDDEGNFIYEGSQAGMLSTSQIMRLSSELSAMYPEGFGLELLDRGESLGRAIFDYVELAKKKKSTVLATIVGEKPAKVPSEVGVFVVRDGVVIPDDAPEPKELL